MKKTLLLTLEYPPVTGGVAQYLYGLFSALPKEKVSVLNGNQLGWGIKIPLRWLPAVWYTWRAIRTERAEVLVISHVLPMGYVALFFKKMKNIPFIVIVHGLDLKTAALVPRKKKFATKILQNAQSVVTNSEFTKNIVVEEYGISKEKTEVVYPCPSHDSMKSVTEAEKNNIISKYGLEGEKVILSVGRLVERKGFDQIIKLLPRLHKFCGKVKYLIVGSGEEEKNLRSLAVEEGVEDSVVFAGRVDGKKLPAFYESAGVFITLSRELVGDVEGFGIVFLEAAYHKLPSIAGRTGGVPEAVVDGKTGFVVDYGSPDEIIGAICNILSDKKVARAMGENAKLRIEKEFNWDVQGAKFQKLLV